MGNSQSAEAPRRPTNKLSKPKTNTSASNLLSVSNGDTSRLTLQTTSRLTLQTDISKADALTRESGPEAASPSEPPAVGKRQSRISLFRSRSTPTKPLPSRIELAQQAQAPSLDRDKIPDPLARYSRFGTLINGGTQKGQALSTAQYPVTRLQRSSTQFQPHSQQLPRLSSVVERPSLNLQYTEPSKQQSNIAENGGLDRRYSTHSSIHSTEYTNSDPSITYPMRRRSLLTPGVATRGSSVRDKSPSLRYSQHEPDISRGNSLHYTPMNEEFQRPVRAATMPAESEVFRQWEASNHITSQLQEFAPPRWPGQIESERVSTPNDLDYGHLSSKLGLLRITNGAVSPGPSLPDKNDADVKPSRMADQEDRSVVAPQGRQSKKETSLQRRYTTDIPAFIRQKMNRRSLLKTDETARDPVAGREQPEAESSTSLQQDLGAELNTKEPKNERIVDRPRSVTGLVELYGDEPPQTCEPKAEMPSLGLFDFEANFGAPLNLTELTPPRKPLNASPQSPTKAVENGSASMQETASNPLSVDASTPSDPQIQDILNPSTLEDQLFDDEPSSTVSLVNSFSTGADSHLSKKSSEEKGVEVKSVKVENCPKQAPPKPLAKADSGYSSIASQRSERSRQFALDVRGVAETAPPPVPEKNVPTTPTNQFTPGSPEEDHRQELPSQRMRFTKNRASSFPNLPLLKGLPIGDGSPLATSKQPLGLPLRRASTISPDGDVGPPPLPPKSPEQQSAAKMHSPVLGGKFDRTVSKRQSLPAPSKTNPPRHRSSVSDASTTSMKAQKQHRSSDPPIVQSSYEIFAASVPPVPDHVFTALAERVKKFPNVTPDHRLHRAMSKETLATIFSVGSVEQSEEAAMFARLDVPTPDVPSDDDAELWARNTVAAMPIANFLDEPAINRKPVPLPKDDVDPQTPLRSLDNTFRRSLSKKRSPTQEEFEHQITSFGTVSESLGASPYDVALSAMSAVQQRSPQSRNMIAAHDVGDRSIARGRMSGMNESTASQFARNRSRMRENERRGSINGTEDQPGYPRRVTVTPTRQTFDDVPPVPPVPAKDETSRLASLPRKTKSPPPVTMATQRRAQIANMSSPSMPAPALPLEAVSVPPLAAPATEPAAIATTSQSTEPQSPVPSKDPWARQREMWRNRRTSAEGLSARPSMEALRPGLENRTASEESVSTQSQQRAQIDRRFSPGPLNQNPIVRRPSPAPLQIGQVSNQEIDRQYAQPPFRQLHSVERSTIYGNNPHDFWLAPSSPTSGAYVGYMLPQLQSNPIPGPIDSYSVSLRRPSLDSSIPRPHMDLQQLEDQYKPRLTQSQSFTNMLSLKQSYAGQEEPLVLDRYSGGIEYGPEFGEITFQQEPLPARRAASWGVSRTMDVGFGDVSGMRHGESMVV